jgi:hypothetical protein
MIREGQTINVYGTKTKIKHIGFDIDNRLWDLVEVEDKIQSTIASIPTNIFYRWEIDSQFNDFHDIKSEENYE